MYYTLEDIKYMSWNQLNEKYYARAFNAINGLCNILNKEWIENELTAFFYSEEARNLSGKEKEYKWISEFELLIFLREDLEILKDLIWFEKLVKKLKKGLRFENVDLEIWIAADIKRCNYNIELEPLVDNNSLGKSDCKILINKTWVFIEITRKQYSTTQKLIDKRWYELAKLVSAINTEKRCILVVKTELNEEEYSSLIEWLKSKPKEGEFENKAIFFSIPHNTDDSILALKYAKIPTISVRQGTQSILDNSFGVVYLHIPDYWIKNVMKDKINQLPRNQQGICFIDVSHISGAFDDWTKQINFTNEFKHFSAIILLRVWCWSNGYLREIKIIRNNKSTNPLTDETNIFLKKFKNLWLQNKNLME